MGWSTGADDRYAGRPSRTGIVRNHVPVPKEIKGGTLRLYETHKEFKTYKINHTENIVKIILY